MVVTAFSQYTTPNQYTIEQIRVINNNEVNFYPNLDSVPFTCDVDYIHAMTGIPKTVDGTQICKKVDETTTVKKEEKQKENKTLTPTTSTGSKIRDKVLKLFYKALSVSKDKSEKCQELAKSIETQLFNITENSASTEYRERARSISFNLKDINNPELRESLYDGTLSVETLVSAKSEDLASKKLRDQRKTERKNAFDANREDWGKDDPNFKSLIQCFKCKQYKVTYTQTRSADEPMTTFYVCQACGNRWRG